MPESQTSPEELAREISRELPSPYCPGRSLASCPSEAARELEREIVVSANAGKSRETIEAELVSRFGIERMGSTVRTDVMWGVGLATVLAIVAVILVGKKWSRGGSAAVSVSGDALAPVSTAELREIAADELDRVDEEVDDLDGLQ